MIELVQSNAQLMLAFRAITQLIGGLAMLLVLASLRKSAPLPYQRYLIVFVVGVTVNTIAGAFISTYVALYNTVIFASAETTVLQILYTVANSLEGVTSTMFALYLLGMLA